MKEYISLIKNVAKQNDFEVTSGEKNFKIYKDKYFSNAYEIKLNDVNYLQVHQSENGHEKFGNCMYSLRDLNDVIKFLNFLITSSELHARR